MQNSDPTVDNWMFKRSLSAAPDHCERLRKHVKSNLIHHIRRTMLFDTVPGFVRIDLIKYYV